MELPRFAVIDVETSGLNQQRHRILQVGIVHVDASGAVLDEWATHVRLDWPLGRVGPTEVHGITRGTLRGAPRLRNVIGEVCERLDNSLMVAHNAQFDGEFLLRAAQRNRVDPDVAARLQRRLCTLRMSRRLDPERVRSHRLGDLCDHYGIALDRPHDALADALATAAILPHLLQAHDITDESQLEPFLDRPRPASPTRHRPGRQS
jgi:DNA polymerase-3 subunit epsilon